MLAADLSPPTPAVIDSAALAGKLQAALRATMFGSRLTITPRRSGQLAATCATSLERYLARKADDVAVNRFGQDLAQEGLGHSSLLAKVEVLQNVALANGRQPDAAPSVERYILALLAGYMQSREAYLLAEQERTRLALERARANTQP
jgi:hypothetical protein